MNGIWITSLALQWAVIIVLGLLGWSLARQLSKLAQKNTYMPDLNEVFVPFAELPGFEIKLANGESVQCGEKQIGPLLIVFFSPKCGACQSLPEAVVTFTQTQPIDSVSLLVVIDISRSALPKFVADKGLESVPMAILADFPDRLRPGGTPFAVTIVRDGRIAAVGKPKCLAHLVEMAETAQHVEGLAPRKHNWGESIPYLYK